jgi:hypothetical protein
MTPFTLGDEILNFGRTYDDEPISVGPGDVLDETQPFDGLFKFALSNGNATGLIKKLHSDSLTSRILGADLDDALRTRRSTTAAPAALDAVIERVSNTVVHDAMTKAARVGAAAPLRKKAVAGIVAEVKRALISRGFSQGVERFGKRGWAALQKHCEQFVAEAIVGA